MDLSKRVREYIERNRMVERGNNVVVAVSGGTDSVALLHLLYYLRHKLGISLHVAHLNHMFRGSESEADACFVADLAKRYHLPATIEAFDVPAYREEMRMSAQAAAREVRYRFLHKVAKSTGAAKVALAHQADDQAETVMINFLRGSGLPGLKGILPVRNDYLIRPLLMVRRYEIERYCADLQLPFRQDSSNLKKHYLRNRVRMNLLPMLENEYNPAMVSNLIRLGGICREEDEYMENQALRAYRKAMVASTGKISLSLDHMLKMPLAIRRRVLRLAWQAFTGTKRDLSYQHTEDALNLLNNNVIGSVASLPIGVVATRAQRSLDLSVCLDRQYPSYYIYPLKVPGATYIPEIDRTISGSLLAGKVLPEPRSLPLNEAVLDFDKLPSKLFVRRRQKGDVFCPYGQNSNVKLKDFLIKQRILREERDFLPLVCTPEEIVWVGGVRIGDKWKIGSGTKKVLHLKLTNGASC
ncbi:MAG: tRNA lysidine(34) synthetase TilS [Desulfotomaculaceae bacterium]|nr:tRNA lysidine(34) synthetase TilS [Desulfotomaculaceae bacterium]